MNRKAKARVPIAFLLLFVFTIALSVGAYFIINQGKLQEHIAAQESQAALQSITDPRQIDEALKRHPSNKILQLIAMANKAAAETSAAAEKLSSEVEPPTLSNNPNLGKASRNDLEALRRDLKTAEANATALLPRIIALLKTERDRLEAYAQSLHADKALAGRFLDDVDKRHAETTAFMSSLSSARAEYYRAYEKYVAVLAGEFGAYKVENGQFIFPLQRTVDRYNTAASAMTAAAKRIGELEQDRAKLMQAQQQAWAQFVSGK